MKTKKISKKGYVLDYEPSHHRANHYGWVFEHIVIAEKATGIKIALPHEVHHVNRKRSDNWNSNLVVCEDRKYHRLLHARARVLEAGGHPGKDKICDACKQLLPVVQFGPKPRHYDGLNLTCKGCDAKRRHERVAAMTTEERTAMRRRGHVGFYFGLAAEQRKILNRKQYESNCRKAGRVPRDGFRYEAGDFGVKDIKWKT